MTLNSPRWLSSGKEFSLMACEMILITVLIAFTLACLPIAIWIGDSGIMALLSATGICVTPGLAALAISHHFSATGRQLPGMLLSMLCRSLPPLVVCLWLALNKTAPQGQVFAGFLIAAYLVSLAAETFLSVRAIPSTERVERE